VRSVGNGLIFHPAQRASAGCLGIVKAIDSDFEVVALDEAHGVEGTAVGIVAEAIDRNDAWMFKVTAISLRH